MATSWKSPLDDKNKNVKLIIELKSVGVKQLINLHQVQLLLPQWNSILSFS